MVDPFEKLIEDSMKPLVHAALAKRISVVLTSILLGMLSFLTLVPFVTATGDVSTTGMLTIVVGALAAFSWLTTSTLYALAKGTDLDSDVTNTPYHHGPHWY